MVKLCLIDIIMYNVHVAAFMHALLRVWRVSGIVIYLGTCVVLIY